MNYGWEVLCILLGALTLYSVANWFFTRKKKKIEPPTPRPGVRIDSIRSGAGSVHVVATGKDTTIRLSGGSDFRGTINGKRVEISVPSEKDWEEIVIESEDEDSSRF